MYQFIINTPLGELGSQHFTEEQMNVIKTTQLNNTGHAVNLNMTLENGDELYMSKEMIGRSVFIVRKIS